MSNIKQREKFDDYEIEDEYDFSGHYIEVDFMNQKNTCFTKTR